MPRRRSSAAALPTPAAIAAKTVKQIAQTRRLAVLDIATSPDIFICLSWQSCDGRFLRRVSTFRPKDAACQQGISRADIRLWWQTFGLHASNEARRKAVAELLAELIGLLAHHAEPEFAGPADHRDLGAVANLGPLFIQRDELQQIMCRDDTGAAALLAPCNRTHAVRRVLLGDLHPEVEARLYRTELDLDARLVVPGIDGLDRLASGNARRHHRRIGNASPDFLARRLDGEATFDQHRRAQRRTRRTTIFSSISLPRSITTSLSRTTVQSRIGTS